MRRVVGVTVLALVMAVGGVLLLSSHTVTAQTTASRPDRAAAASAARNGSLLGGARGVVRDAKGSPIEGVMVQLVAAQTAIRTTVYTNHLGQYEFPRLGTGDYTMRLPRPLEYRPYRQEGVRIDGATVLPELRLERIAEGPYLPPTPDILPQLTGAEYLANLPGSEREKDAVVSVCGASCHSFSNQFRARFDETSWRLLVHRMSNYGYRILVPPPPPTRRFSEEQEMVVKFLSRVRGVDATDGPLKAFPRPYGPATRAIVTEYELPWATVNIHDVAGDAAGNIWFTINRSPFIGMLEPKTGRVTSYRIAKPPPMVIKPQRHPVREDLGIHPGLHWVEVDHKTGTVWFTDTWSEALGTLNPKTGDIQQVNVGLHGNVALAPDGLTLWKTDQGKIKKYDAASVMKNGLPVKEYPMKTLTSTYGTFVSRDNRYVGGGGTQAIVWLDTVTGEMREVPGVTGKSMNGRGDFDPSGNIWVGGKMGTLVKYDPKLNVLSEYQAPTPHVAFYTARADNKGEIWAGEMHGGRIARFNPRTQRWIEYQLPTPFSQDYFSWIDNSTNPVTFWYGDQFGYIVRVQPLE